MREFFDKIKSKTRWNIIPGSEDSFRLSCSNETCSLSCANIRGGRISTTSMHGDERHSYILSKNDMTFATLLFLNSLSEDELERFCKMFTKISPSSVLNYEKI